jgi:uncharacterized membrane protein YphA (DoxX/SURF4 family)
VMAVQAYQILPVSVGEFVGYALPLFELALAVALLLGVATRITAIVTAGLMFAFVIGVTSAWARGLSIDCGCFGGGGAVPEGEANYLPVLLRDVGFTLMAAWLVVFPASKFAVDRGGRAGTGDTGLYDESEEYDQGHDDDGYDDPIGDTADDSVNDSIDGSDDEAAGDGVGRHRLTDHVRADQEQQ